MRKFSILSFSILALIALPAFAAESDVPRTASGRVDLSGTYDAGTVTPLERPAQFGDNLYLTPEEAKALEEQQQAFWAEAEAAKNTEGGERGAPQKGGDGDNRFGGGGVGGYNIFWIDPGSEATMVDGKFRTSILQEPKNGRRPPMTPKAMRRLMTNFASFAHNNDGTASWLAHDGPGPFDGPESLALAERCIIGFSGGPPMMPSLYNNYLTIVQAEDYVVILNEMVHDARIVRIDGEHGPEGVERWQGQSVGHWEGDTLVIETTNFGDRTLVGGGEAMKITERLSRTPEGNVLYNFRVDDPESWTAPWAGEYTWTHKDSKVYEYACHEGNYAMGNILRGARLLESEWEGGDANSSGE